MAPIWPRDLPRAAEMAAPGRPGGSGEAYPRSALAGGDQAESEKAKGEQAGSGKNKSSQASGEGTKAAETKAAGIKRAGSKGSGGSVAIPPAVEAAFILSAAKRKQFPEPASFEVPVLGRSNCGKSSLLNRWIGRRAMARVGGTPGRTRLANFFRVVFKPGDAPMLVVDLPGYGFAAAPKDMVDSWRSLLEDYLTADRGPRLALLLMDIRRAVQDEERDLAGWLASLGLGCQVVATKSDKLSPPKRRAALAAIGRELGASPLAFSSLTGQGREELITVVREARILASRDIDET